VQASGWTTSYTINLKRGIPERKERTLNSDVTKVKSLKSISVTEFHTSFLISVNADFKNDFTEI